MIIAAKFASTALIARIFLLTKPALMQIPWFAYAYGVFVPWQEALFARIRASWPWRYGRILKWRAEQYVRQCGPPCARGSKRAGALRQLPQVRRAIGLRMRLAARDLWARVSPPPQRSEPRQLPPPDARP